MLQATPSNRNIFIASIAAHCYIGIHAQIPFLKQNLTISPPAYIPYLRPELLRAHSAQLNHIKTHPIQSAPFNAHPGMSSQPLLSTAPGKRIALPTRVEPKVFFANERTFLSWLNFTVILGGLAIGLLNFGDSIGRICAGLFTLVAMGAMLYALVTFHWRAKSIRLRGQGGFDDRYGPTVLAVALAAAVIVNFVLRVTGT